MASTNLNVQGIDFDDIKKSLKIFLKSQDKFKDYDFEGSGLNILLDVLAYNTHYGALYAHMIANETFLDSALLKPSVVSIAKHLNYVPKSYSPSTAYVNVEFLNLNTDINTKNSIENGTYFITQGSRFSANVGNRIFVFRTSSDVQVRKEGSRYFARNIEIKEYTPKTITYVFDPNQNIDQKFVIPELNVDVESISVRVLNSINDTTGSFNLWERVKDLNKLTGESYVYFVQQNPNLQYEIYFGDGILGRNLISGNVVTILYNTTYGPLANEIGKNETSSSPSFKYMEYGNSRTLLLTDSLNNPSPSFGGSLPENIDSVKYYAPRNYQAQERAVTPEDYRTLLAREYGEQAESIFVWGGEDSDPPQYGKVFVSIKPFGANKLSSVQKRAIERTILKERNLVSIIPELVDPDYLYIILTLTVRYNSSKTQLSKENLETQIKLLITEYAKNKIGKFDRTFIDSEFTTHVNTNYNPPVLSCNIDLKLKKNLEVNLNTIGAYTINFNNELYHPVNNYDPIISSSAFGYQDPTSSSIPKENVDAYIDDDGNGKLRIYKFQNGQKIYINNEDGTIDYITGKLILLNFSPQYLSPESNTTIQITAIPKFKDIEVKRNQIISLLPENIFVNCVPQLLKYDPYIASGTPFPQGNN